jgi:cyclophilin family peptidyl-prolyl cis-trans isomerase
MQIYEENKSNSAFILLIIAVIIIGSAFAFSKIMSSQGEDKIPLRKEGEEDLSEPLVSGSAQRILIPPKSPPSAVETGETAQAEPDPNMNLSSNSIPSMTITEDKIYKALLDTTMGMIIIELDNKNTPITANNFVVLSRKQFYNSTVFHRVIEGFMIQGGDPTGTGTGGPGYRFDDEPVTGEYTRGVVAMANAGPNTNGSQFFIMQQNKLLPKQYVIFGKVTEGMDVVDKIAQSPVKISPSGEKSSPIDTIRLNSVEIVETPVVSQ